MRCLVIFLLSLVAVSAYPRAQRIVGGAVTSINQYPDIAALLARVSTHHVQDCGSAILNNRGVLTAAHCTFGHPSHRFRVRVGSTNANSGGHVLNVHNVINHPHYNMFNNDIAIVRTQTQIHFSPTVRQARIAGATYPLGDNQVVWAAGWGLTAENGNPSEQLRHVQIWTVNHNTCRHRHGPFITDNMLCAGWLDVGGRDTCTGDSGGPLYHNGVVVGVVSFGVGCGRPRYPGVYARVSRFAHWISQNK